jgi:predicted transcriptional regulator
MKNLVKLRKVAGLTQFTMAKKSGVSRWTVANYETGRVEYTPAERKKILAVLIDAIQKNVVDLQRELQNDIAAETAGERLCS